MKMYLLDRDHRHLWTVDVKIDQPWRRVQLVERFDHPLYNGEGAALRLFSLSKERGMTRG